MVKNKAGCLQYLYLFLLYKWLTPRGQASCHSLLEKRKAQLSNAAMIVAANFGHQPYFFTCIKDKKLPIRSALHLKAMSFDQQQKNRKQLGKNVHPLQSFPVYVFL